MEGENFDIEDEKAPQGKLAHIKISKDYKTIGHIFGKDNIEIYEQTGKEEIRIFTQARIDSWGK